MTPQRSHFAWIGILWLCWVQMLTPSNAMGSQEGARQEVAPIRLVDVGFQGVLKVGHWVPVKVEVDETLLQNDDRIVIESTDPEGGQIEYENDHLRWQSTGDQRATVSVLLKFGSVGSQFRVRWVRSTGQPIAAATWEPAPSQMPLASDHRVVLSLGGDAGIGKLLQQRSRSRHEQISHVHLSGEQLPSSLLAYSCVDAVAMIIGSDTDLANVSRTRWQRFVEWVHQGGRVVLIGTGDAGLLTLDGPLQPLLPGELKGTVSQRQTTAIESFAKAAVRLDQAATGAFSFPMADLQLHHGQVELWQGYGAAQKPCIVRSGCGLGQVVFVGLDLAADPFRQWPGRDHVVNRVLQMALDTQEFDEGLQSDIPPMAHVGYSDLVGQLRSALDQFLDVRLVPFSWIAGLAAVYILLMGPVDYWLLRRWRRAEWTWLTFLLTVVAFTGLASWLATRWKGDRMLVNQVTVVDADALTGETRGTVWTHVYSPRTQRIDVAASPSPPFLPAQPMPADGELAWQGLPGDGFGGLRRVGTSSLFDGAYQCRLAVGPQRSQISLDRLPIAVWSSRSLGGHWWGRGLLDQSDNRNNRLKAATDGSVSGRLTNPWSVDLHEAYLVHDRWVYGLGTLKANESRFIETSYGTDLQALLMQRKVEKGRNVVTPWNRESTNVKRILQLMLFYDAAKGRAYTQLKHRYQDELDWSHHLKNGRAILWGLSAQPGSEVRVNEQIVSPHQSVTCCRYLIPLNFEDSTASDTLAEK